MLVAALLLATPVAPAASFLVAGPPVAWAAADGRGSADILLRSAQPLSQVGVVHSDLTEAKTRRHLASSDLFLAKLSEACGTGARTVNLPANELVRTRLCVASDAHGTYNGTIRLGPDGGEPSAPIATTIFLSSQSARTAGTLLLVLGAALAFLVTRFSANRIARAQALLPLALLRERALQCAAVLKRARHQFPGELPAMFSESNEFLANHLSERSAEAALFVPPRFPLFWQITARAGAFASFLTTADKHVTLLSTLVRLGVEPVLEFARSASNTDLRQALAALDEMWRARPSIANATRDSRRVVAALNATVAPAASGASLGVDSGPEMTTDRLFTQVRSFSALAWSLVSLGTILTGWVTLIANNPGFGLPADFVTCFIAGFVIPASAGAIASPMLSQATAVAVSNPRREG